MPIMHMFMQLPATGVSPFIKLGVRLELELGASLRADSDGTACKRTHLIRPHLDTKQKE